VKQSRAEAGEFRGQPVITIYTGHEYQGTEEMVTMGVRKTAAMCDQGVCGEERKNRSKK
jgi:hypothetical protein